MFRDRNPGQTPSPLQPAQRETKKAKFSGGKGPVAQWLERQSAGKNRSGLTQTWPGSWEPEAGTGVPPGGCYPSPSWSLRVEAVLSGLWPWPLKHWGSNLSVELFLCLRLPCLVKGEAHFWLGECAALFWWCCFVSLGFPVWHQSFLTNFFFAGCSANARRSFSPLCNLCVHIVKDRAFAQWRPHLTKKNCICYASLFCQ